MCNCRKEVENNLKAELIKTHPTMTDVRLDHGLTSKRILVCGVYEENCRGKMKERTVSVSLAICPFCGRSYDEMEKEDLEKKLRTEPIANVEL